MTALEVFPQLKWLRPESGALSLAEAKVNCGAAGGAGLANHSLGLVPGDVGFVTHHAMRLASGDPRRPGGGPAGLTSASVATALSNMGCDATRYFGASYTVARDALKAGFDVGVCIHYPVINAFWDGQFSGQLTFKGEHFVALRGWTQHDKRVKYRNSTTSHDSLYDGRKRNWGTAPDGPQTVPFMAYRAAMAEFRVIRNGQVQPVGKDKGVFIVVKP